MPRPCPTSTMSATFWMQGSGCPKRRGRSVRRAGSGSMNGEVQDVIGGVIDPKRCLQTDVTWLHNLRSNCQNADVHTQQNCSAMSRCCVDARLDRLHATVHRLNMRTRHQ